jgi:hypothetical protein
MTDPHPGRQRLDSWKAIAKYLNRDLATVRRWEKGLGLPIHRVGGSGRSVFAYVSEIETWLGTARPPAGAPSLVAARTMVSAITPRAWLVLSLIVAALVATLYAAGWRILLL